MRDLGSDGEQLGRRRGPGNPLLRATRPMRQAGPAVAGVHHRGALAQRPALRNARHDAIRVAAKLHGEAASPPSAGAGYGPITPTPHVARRRGREGTDAAGKHA